MTDQDMCGVRVRVRQGEGTNWFLAGTDEDYEIGTVRRVQQIGDQRLAFIEVRDGNGGLIAMLAVRAEDIPSAQIDETPAGSVD